MGIENKMTEKLKINNNIIGEMIAKKAGSKQGRETLFMMNKSRKGKGSRADDILNIVW